MNSIKYNPENLDSLLSLGVSCTNILDEVKAMNFLKKWIILNPKYKHLNVDPNIIPDDQSNLYTYKIEEIKMMNDRLITVFESATQQFNNDPELFVIFVLILECLSHFILHQKIVQSFYLTIPKSSLFRSNQLFIDEQNWSSNGSLR